MQAGIVTFTFGDNYGQRLQNLAMQEFLKQYIEDVYTLPQVPLRQPFKYRVKLLLKKILKGTVCSTFKRSHAFAEFDNNYINYYPIPIQPGADTMFPERDFDFFVCGSDQIWSPYSPDVNDTMFLTFAPEYKRISLSPSIASPDIPKEKMEKYKTYFRGFRFISTREFESSDLVEKISGKKAETLIDPTLMFDADFWSVFAQKPRDLLPDRYALLYFLGNDSKRDEIISICQKNGLAVIDLLKDKKYSVLGPSEFIYLIQHAQMVYTDSYHGTIFSLLYERPFTLFERSGTSLNMTSRFSTLFTKLNIHVQMAKEIDESSCNHILLTEFADQLNRERERFTSFFKLCKEAN